jgi:hypothetical protein
MFDEFTNAVQKVTGVNLVPTPTVAAAPSSVLSETPSIAVPKNLQDLNVSLKRGPEGYTKEQAQELINKFKNSSTARIKQMHSRSNLRKVVMELKLVSNPQELADLLVQCFSHLDELKDPVDDGFDGYSQEEVEHFRKHFILFLLSSPPHCNNTTYGTLIYQGLLLMVHAKQQIDQRSTIPNSETKKGDKSSDVFANFTSGFVLLMLFCFLHGPNKANSNARKNTFDHLIDANQDPCNAWFVYPMLLAAQAIFGDEGNFPVLSLMGGTTAAKESVKKLPDRLKGQWYRHGMYSFQRLQQDRAQLGETPGYAKGLFLEFYRLIYLLYPSVYYKNQQTFHFCEDTMEQDMERVHSRLPINVSVGSETVEVLPCPCQSE